MPRVSGRLVGFLRAALLAAIVSVAPAPYHLAARVAAAPEPVVRRSVQGGVTASGTVEANYSVPLVASAPGWVKQVFFTDGDYVRRHQILLKFLHNDPYSTAVNRGYLLAPRAGFVVQKNAQVGQHVKTGSCMATLQDVAQVKVTLVATPPPGRAMHVCDPVVVRVAELPGRVFAGLIESVTSLPASRSGRVVVVAIQNLAWPLIRPRMHAQVWLPTRPLPPPMASR